MELPASKSRGAVFTPQEVSGYIARWAIRKPDDTVLEPSCGEASFLAAAADRLSDLNHTLFPLTPKITGVEIHPDSAQFCRRMLQSAGVEADIQEKDFFDFDPDERFDAVVGNPPYVRYQRFTGEHRAKALRAALAQGVALSGLASSWAAFVVHAAKLLKPGGRLGFVLPAELLSVNYAAPVRRFLLNRFSSINLVTFEQRIFSDALEDVVLLLAEGQGGCDYFKVYSARSADCLQENAAATWHGIEFDENDDKWSAALAPGDGYSVFEDAVAATGFVPVTEWGDAYLGAVTGNNNFFALTAAEADAAGLKRDELLQISPPGSRHLRGFTFTETAWREAAEGGARCFLFYPRTDQLSRAARTFIEVGEQSGIHNAYKCQVRRPWWKVPVVDTADLFITYMDAERPRFVRNSAKVKHLNSLYGLRLKTGMRQLGRDLLPLVAINSITLLAAEYYGRAYGGGMLKLEPREADALPVPPKSLIAAHANDLRAVVPQAAWLISQGNLAAATRLVDEILFAGMSSFSDNMLESVRAGRQSLWTRRKTRSKKKARVKD